MWKASMAPSTTSERQLQYRNSHSRVQLGGYSPVNQGKQAKYIVDSFSGSAAFIDGDSVASNVTDSNDDFWTRYEQDKRNESYDEKFFLWPSCDDQDNNGAGDQDNTEFEVLEVIREVPIFRSIDFFKDEQIAWLFKTSYMQIKA